MSEAIGIRFDENFLKKIEKLSEEETLDRSSIIRKLSYLGYKEFMKEKAARWYVESKTTMSGAAKMAGITIWELQEYLVNKGFVSKYSLQDLNEELNLLN
ncbi:hypothetical protein COV11_02935 [Candidatus Woesearchaeota archaeon CG10_big_fil_rev_8_21_14_0_10_30_7]|nr:MAG: hypothetical protein COV11_02935 [Candidatus Woesearchaeota archaeon CG10_big_fil_rev_8_21_14_0_10_30_7]